MPKIYSRNNPLSRLYLSVIAVLSILLILGACKSSQKKDDQSPIMKKYDKNGDGRISRKEFTGSDAVFRSYDHDRNGFVTQKEIAAGRKTVAGQGQGQGKGKDGVKSGQQTSADPAKLGMKAVFKNEVYKSVADNSLQLDVYHPLNNVADSYPLLVYIHGGGFRGGDKVGKLFIQPTSGLMKLATQNGFCIASVNYRLVRKTTPQKVNMVHLVADCKDAVRYLVKNSSKFKIDPDRICIVGTSAGAYLAMMTALTPGNAFNEYKALSGVSFKARCCVDWYGPADFDDLSTWQGRKAQGTIEDEISFLFGGDLNTQKELIRNYSPVTRLDKTSPPLLVVHGKIDPIVPVGQARALKQKAQQAGIKLAYLEVKGAAHGFSQKTTAQIQPSQAEINKRTIDFIKNNTLK